MGIIKLSSNGASKIYATYLGGSDSETPHSLFSDQQGNLVVLGRTYSTNFPFKTTAGVGGAADMFVAKINAAGSALIGCMRIGGSGNDCVNMEDQVRTRYEEGRFADPQLRGRFPQRGHHRRFRKYRCGCFEPVATGAERLPDHRVCLSADFWRRPSGRGGREDRSQL
ncbi:hypothetical protein ACQ86N_05770 [Puia sp. P3]|uniref:hypothetical protein n=1 Tax=Puia sp. P3 TaxID=3423952 RepID=UPI003D67CCBF